MPFYWELPYLILLFTGPVYKKKNPQAVLRSVMGATMVKLFVLAALVIIYLVSAGSARSIYALIVSMGLYIIYSWLETKILLQMKSPH